MPAPCIDDIEKTLKTGTPRKNKGCLPLKAYGCLSNSLSVLRLESLLKIEHHILIRLLRAELKYFFQTSI
jgi:hypothetical protein